MRCVAAGASKERTVPRSIVQFLEGELGKAADSGAGAASSEDDPDKIMLADQVIGDMTPPFGGLTSALPLVRCVVGSTRLPSTTLLEIADPNDGHPQPAADSTTQPNGRLSTIPTAVADFLFENYMTRVVAQFPIFYSADVGAYFNSVFHNSTSNLEPGTSATPYEIYVISLIMAISLTTAARTQQVWANSIAACLFREAMQHISSACTNDVTGLQALLLLLEYSFLDPTAANVWLLSGFTTQACIDLGLHREGPGDQRMDALTMDVRRRVFWCTYEMEIASSGALLRPSAFYNMQIDIPFPAEVDDSSISMSGIDVNGCAAKLASRRIWQFRQIEAEIVSVLFHQGEISPCYTTPGAWMNDVETRINNWNQEIHWSASINTDSSKMSQWEEMCLYADIAHNVIIVTLFRPSPRIKEPSCENLMKAFRAGVNVADGYWKQSNLGFGSSKFVFHPCYHTFSAAIVFLMALRCCKETVSATYSLSQVENFIACFSRFFATIAERWPAASRCLEEFERLMAPVKREYVDHTVQWARKIPQNPSYGQIPPFGENDELTLDSMGSLDSINFGPLSLSATGLWDNESPELPLAFPIDWNAEFDFGMN